MVTEAHRRNEPAHTRYGLNTGGGAEGARVHTSAHHYGGMRVWLRYPADSLRVASGYPPHRLSMTEMSVKCGMQLHASAPVRVALIADIRFRYLPNQWYGFGVSHMLYVDAT